MKIYNLQKCTNLQSAAIHTHFIEWFSKKFDKKDTEPFFKPLRSQENM